MLIRTQLLFFILVVFLSTQAIILIPSQGVATLNTSAMIKEVVCNFYENYLKAQNNKENFNLEQQPQLDPLFVKKIEDLIKSAEESEPGFLGYDPILMAQDIPESMEYHDPIIAEDKAAMLVDSLWGEDYKTSLCVLLSQKGGYWRITDIRDQDWDEDTLRECRPEP